MIGKMLIRLCVLAVVTVSLVCAADRQRAADSAPENMTDGSTRERRSYRYDLFSWNYEKVEVASQGWKAHDVRGKVMPVLLKLGGTVYTTVSSALKVKSYVNKATEFARRTMNENEHFKSVCVPESVNVTGITPCTASLLVLEVLSLSTSITGGITEAYIRTRLNSSTEMFKIINDGVFMLITEAVSTELVMLGHFIRMAQKFGSVLATRYFSGPLPVKGTEKVFVKACDNLYAAVSDFFLISRMVIEHTLERISEEINSTTAGLAHQFHKVFENLIVRGIPQEYDYSPFPPLSYYWDMAALEYAVSVLTDLSVTANQTLSGVVDESEDLFVQKAFISNMVYAARASLNDTIAHMKNDRLNAALDSAINGLRMTVYAYHEAGLDIPSEQGSEALIDNLESFLENLKSSSELNTPINIDILRSASGVASVFGITNKGVEVSYRELFSFLLPTDHDHLITMVREISEVINRSSINGYASRILAAPVATDCSDVDTSKLDDVVKREISNIDSLDNSNIEDYKLYVNEPSDNPPVVPLTWARLMYSLAPSVPPGLQGHQFTEMMNIVLKHANLQFLHKIQDPASCVADPGCWKTFSKIATEAGKVIGIDVKPESLTPLSSPFKGAERTNG